MKNEEYEALVYSKIEKKFDKAILFSAILTWVAVIVIYFSDIPRIFIFIDSAIAIVLVIISVFKNRINIKTKIYMSIFFPAIVGIAAFFIGGFNTSGVTLVLLANLIAVVFFNRKRSIPIAIASGVFFVLVWVWSKATNAEAFLDITNSLWLTLFVVYTLFLILLQVMVHAIKDYLLNIINDLEKSGKKTYELAYFDHLTGLPNEINFREQLSNIGEHDGFMVFVHFKNIGLIRSIFNEQIGDQVLIESGKMIQSFGDENMILARTGSEDFAIWIVGINEEDLLKKLSLIQQRFNKKLNIPELQKHVEICMSYSSCNKEEKSIDACYQKTKIALTYAKKGDCSNLVAYNKELEQVIRHEENMKELIKNAIKEDEFVLYYQTKVDARNGKIVGVEALARWFSPVLGLVSPVVFLPIIEDMRYATSFGCLIVKKALEDYPELCKKYNKNISLSINISPSHFLDNGFTEFIHNITKAYKINTEKIILEVTEEMMIEDINHINNVLGEVQDLGIRTSIDDFGSGYATFNYLANLKVNELKIDKSFIDQIGTNDKVESMLKSIIALAKDLDLSIVAEGVEHKEQYELLRGLKCPIIQGYYFSKPEPIENK